MHDFNPFTRDIDPVMGAWQQAAEAHRVARAEFGWLLLGVFLVVGILVGLATLWWISRGGLRRFLMGSLTTGRSIPR